ncbi:MAG: leucine--tRNA ligase [Bacteroidia bacterium]|nr:leucine--tRNA ligase [Bacteroidia bacterium]
MGRYLKQLQIMSTYDFGRIEKKWQEVWQNTGIYRVSNASDRPKYYILDMFPYPSGSGLHVGHPLGYIASDIYARYKRLKGFNVLHPMGYDAFGLPAEQYALDHKVHPAVSTEANIRTFRSQLDNIGFCYDWDREIRTCEPQYYKWTQWIFLQLFDSWYNIHTDRAERIAGLVDILATEGNINHPSPGLKDLTVTAAEWNSWSETRQREVLMSYRLAYLDYADVWWCEALGTVLANDEVVNGVSERGGHPVVRRQLRQWFLRITAYADRLLAGLEQVAFSESLKEMQRNWIGKSFGAEIDFAIEGHDTPLRVYTTRPDTIFGVDFMVVAPEHEIVARITPDTHREAVEAYLAYTQSRSELERMSEKKISGCFTGAYAINPFDGRRIPIWVAEYVLAGYGTGAIMAVPCGDERDFAFARHFDISITNILGDLYDGTAANPTKDGVLSNSGFITGVPMSAAILQVIEAIEARGIGRRQTNYRMRDAGFSRQRYWGEPFPIVYRQDVPYALDESQLPLELPVVDSYSQGPDGQGPLANLTHWTHLPDGTIRETNTMPGYAGSSWYFLRYMDPHNTEAFCSREASDYWGQVDLYIGGTEHAVGHLLYSRMWTKVLYDLGYIGFEEPYKKLVNQGKIGGDSRLIYRVRGTQTYVSAGLREAYETDELHVDVNLVNGVELDTAAFRKSREDYAQAEFILEDGVYRCGTRLEKMGKRYLNAVNPDAVVAQYGADTFRMYEMFLGPVEADKPWDMQGIEGVHRFLRKLWRLFMDERTGPRWTDDAPTASELRTLHKTLRKVEEDTERFSFNTCVSAFMVCVNELTEQDCHKRAVLEPVLVALCPFAPFIAEELWAQLGHTDSVLVQPFPAWDPALIEEDSVEYPVQINGKVRAKISLPRAADNAAVEAAVLAHATVQQWMEGKPPKKVIVVPGKIVNIVV